MSEPRSFPWPAAARVPRWARDRRGRAAEPEVSMTVQVDNLDCYHIGLYRLRGVFKHVVVVVEPGPARAGDPPAPDSWSTTIIRVGWHRDPLAVFEQTVARYRDLSLHFGEHRN